MHLGVPLGGKRFGDQWLHGLIGPICQSTGSLQPRGT